MADKLAKRGVMLWLYTVSGSLFFACLGAIAHLYFLARGVLSYQEVLIYKLLEQNRSQDRLVQDQDKD